MFHLWHKRLSLALFPDRLLRGGDRDPVILPPSRSGNEALFAAFADALLDAKRTSRRKICLSLALSDSYAAIVALPWQAALSSAAEIDAYAHAQFERSGQPLDESWLMFSYYRHYGSTGLAYALPTDFVQRLHEIAASHDVAIDSILPLSALVYARQERQKRGEKALVLRESGRVTALVAGAGGMTRYATEPEAGGSGRSVERLMRRLQAEHDVQGVEAYAPESGIQEELSTLVSRIFPSARCTAANFSFWMR